jgi:hypothetical protein
VTNIQSEATDDSMREEQIGKAGTTVKEGVISSLEGIKEIEAEIVSLGAKRRVKYASRNERCRYRNR